LWFCVPFSSPAPITQFALKAFKGSKEKRPCGIFVFFLQRAKQWNFKNGLNRSNGGGGVEKKATKIFREKYNNNEMYDACHMIIIKQLEGVAPFRR
jgi:hypothetical protein